MIFYAIAVVAITAIVVDTYSSQVQVKYFNSCFWEFVRTFSRRAKCDEDDGRNTVFS